MSKNNSATQITFLGDSAAELAPENAEAVHFIQAAALEIPHATVKVYTAPRDALARLKWQLIITSPRGRQTYMVRQRSLNGSITASPD